MVFKGKPMTGPIIIEKAKSFSEEVKITDKYTSSDGCNKRLLLRTYVSIGTV
jgi:hypothetical protein